MKLFQTRSLSDWAHNMYTLVPDKLTVIIQQRYFYYGYGFIMAFQFFTDGNDNHYKPKCI